MHFQRSHGSCTHERDPNETHHVKCQLFLADLISRLRFQVTQLRSKSFCSKVATLHGVSAGAYQTNDVLLRQKGSEIAQVPTLLLQHYQLLTVLMNETSSPSISLASPCSCGLEPAFCILSTGTYSYFRCSCTVGKYVYAHAINCTFRRNFKFL